MHRIAALEPPGDVDDVQDERRALDVTQELVPEALALGGALDETGDVGDDEAQVVARAHHAQVGLQRRERVVGNLGTRGGHAGDQRALAHRRHSDERRIGHELHLELDPQRFGGLAQLGKRRGAARRGDEVRVAPAASAALCHDDALTVAREVGDLLDRLHLLVEQADHCAAGNLEDHVGAVGAVHALAAAMRPLLGLEVMLVAIVDERRDGAVRPCRRRRRRGHPWGHVPRV